MFRTALALASVLTLVSATDSLAAAKKRTNWSEAYASAPAGVPSLSAEEQARFDPAKGFVQGY